MLISLYKKLGTDYTDYTDLLMNPCNSCNPRLTFFLKTNLFVRYTMEI